MSEALNRPRLSPRIINYFIRQKTNFTFTQYHLSSGIFKQVLTFRKSLQLQPLSLKTSGFYHRIKVMAYVYIKRDESHFMVSFYLQSIVNFPIANANFVVGDLNRIQP